VGGFWNFVVRLLKSAGIEDDRKWSGFSVNAKSLQQYNTLWLSGMRETSVCFYTEKFWVFDVFVVFTLCVGLYS
jgi:hypothetical protein